MPEFTNRPEIFHDKDLLERDHIPDTFEGRETELRKYKDALYPVYKGEKPKNIFLYGDSGTGKTSVTRYLKEHLIIDAKQDEGIDITSVYVNCHGLATSYQLARELVNSLREQRRNDTQANLSKKGYSKGDMFEFLFDELERTNGSTVLILDELDNINDHDLLYQLPRAHSNQRLSDDTRAPCIIGISNDADYLSNLDPNIADTLNDQTIHFTPYNANTLQNILQHRADDAFYNGVLTDAVIPRAAALAAQENGSARRALRLLRIAGEIARNERERTVTEHHVEQAESELNRELVKESINAGTIQTQLALLSVASAASTNRTPARTSNLHGIYENICDIIGINALQHDRYRQRLETLAERSIIKSETKNDDGQYSEYSLAKPLVVILDALAETRRLAEPIEHILNNADDNYLKQDVNFELPTTT